MRTRANSPPINLTREAEPFSPPLAALTLVQSTGQAIRSSLGKPPAWFDYYVRNHTPRVAFDVGLTQRWLPRDRPVADIGSAPFLLTGALHRLGYDVTGVDIDPSRLQRAIDALQLRVQRCNFETDRLPWDDGALGGLLFNEVFEHLRINLIRTLSELRRVLQPGGLLLLSTPNGAGLHNLRNLLVFDRGLDNSVYSAFHDLEEIGHMGHIREYTLTDVVEFLDAVGFDCLHAVYRGRYSTNVMQAMVRLRPSLRPHFTVVARKRADGR